MPDLGNGNDEASSEAPNITDLARNYNEPDRCPRELIWDRIQKRRSKTESLGDKFTPPNSTEELA